MFILIKESKRISLKEYISLIVEFVENHLIFFQFLNGCGHYKYIEILMEDSIIGLNEVD